MLVAVFLLYGLVVMSYENQAGVWWTTPEFVSSLLVAGTQIPSENKSVVTCYLSKVRSKSTKVHHLYNIYLVVLGR